MLDPADVRRESIDPALVAIGHYTKVDSDLVLGTAIVESNLQYRHQLGGGPALGLWQMEPTTYMDCFVNYLDFRPALKAKVVALAGPFTGDYPPSSELVNNDPFAAAMCRVKYLRNPEILPPTSDARTFAAMHKKWYNTAGGATDMADSIPKFQLAIDTP